MFEIQDTMGGFMILLPAEPGHRLFAEVVLATMGSGMEFSWYDTRGMVIDLMNHIRPVDRRIGLRTSDQMLEWLRGHGVDLVAATTDGRACRVEFRPGALLIHDADSPAVAAEIRFPSVGMPTVHVPGHTKSISIPNRLGSSWAHVAAALASAGLVLSAVPAPSVAPSHGE